MTRLVKALAFSICLAALMTAWSILLKHNVARTERVFAQVPAQSWGQLVLGADILEYRKYFRRFPTRLSDISMAPNSVRDRSIAPNNVFVEHHKRPLYGLVSASLTVMLHEVAGISYPVSMYAILSLYASVATLLMYLLLRRVGLPAIEAALLTAVCTFSFAWLSIFSIPESYSLSVCAALLAMLSGSRLPQLGTPGAWRAVLRHAMVTGVLAWIYPLVCGAVLLVISRVQHRKELVSVVLPAAVIAAGIAILPAAVISAAIALAPQLFGGEGGVQAQIDYVRLLASWTNFANWRLLVEVGTAFLFLGLIAPVADFVSATRPHVHMANVGGAWTTVMGIAIILACFIKLALVTLAHRNIKRLRGALLWFLALFLFHAFFNPREVLLYLSVPVAVLIYIVGLALVPWYERYGTAFNGGRKAIVSLLGGLAVLLIVINLRVVAGI